MLDPQDTMLKPSQKIIPALKELTICFLSLFHSCTDGVSLFQGNTFSWWIVKDEFFS